MPTIVQVEDVENLTLYTRAVVFSATKHGDKEPYIDMCILLPRGGVKLWYIESKIRNLLHTSNIKICGLNYV